MYYVSHHNDLMKFKADTMSEQQ